MEYIDIKKFCKIVVDYPDEDVAMERYMRSFALGF